MELVTQQQCTLICFWKVRWTSNYSASKAGVLALTKTLAKELWKYNISVNTICPGFIDTDLNRHNAKKAIAQNNSSLAIDSSLEELINFLVYMVSDKFINISGKTFNLDSRIFRKDVLK